jgi:hypothetical protein
MRPCGSTSICRLGLVLLIASCMGWAAPQPQTQPAGYTQAEYDAYVAANNQQALDAFVANYPNSALLPYIYRAFYLTYFRLRNYPQMLQYLDKILALDDRIDFGMRMETLAARAQGYTIGCGDDALRTFEGYTEAKEAANQGLQALRRWQKPSDMTDQQFAEQSKALESLFNTAADVAKAGLEDPQANPCKTLLQAPPSDPGKFDRMIAQILVEERQAPRVR